MDAFFYALAGLVLIMEAAYLAFELARTHRHRGQEQGQTPSELDMYLLMRSRKNETMRKMRQVADEARGVTSSRRHRDDWLR